MDLRMIHSIIFLCFILIIKPVIANTSPSFKSGIAVPALTKRPHECIDSSAVSVATHSLHKQSEDINALTPLVDVDSIQTTFDCEAERSGLLDLRVETLSRDEGRPDPGDGGDGGSNTNPDVTLPNTVWQTDVESKIKSIGHDLEGEQVDYSNGSLSFRHVDVSLPGNSPLSVEFARTYRIDGIDYSGNVLGGWTPDIPFITMRLDGAVGFVSDGGLGTASSCFTNAIPRLSNSTSGAEHEKLWGNIRMSIPGRGIQTLVRPSKFSVNHPYNDPNISNFHTRVGTTTDNWKISCSGSIKNAPGSAITATDPNGNKYYFDVFVKRYAGFETHSITVSGNSVIRSNQTFHYNLYASKVVDASGNQVSYTYDSTGYLTRISANDGRRIDINYSQPVSSSLLTSDGDPLAQSWERTYKHISSVSANGRTWLYYYASPSNDNFHTTTQLNLRTVTLPNNKKWTFNLPLQNNRATEYYNSYRCFAADNFDYNGYTGSWMKRLPNENYVIHPEGSRTDYKFKLIKDAGGRKNQSGAPLTSMDENLKHSAFYTRAMCEDKFSNMTVLKALVEKKLTKTDGENYRWQFSYDESNHCRAPSVNAKSTKKRTEYGPDATRIDRFYYCDNPENGNLARKEVHKDGLLQTSTYQYDVERYPTALGYKFPDVHFEQKRVLLKQQKTQRTSDVYTRNYTYNINQASSGYSFGKPLQILESSNVQSGQRSFTFSYQDNLNSWILSRLTKITQNGKELKRFSYDSLGRVKEVRKYGRISGKYSYKSSPSSEKGMLSEFTDALGRKTYFSNYKGGLAQKVKRPDGEWLERSVDANGWITKIQDAKNNCTNYRYDTVGRLTLIDPCNSKWLNTSISYSTTTGTEGLSYVTAGMLKQTYNKGNYQKIIYHDSLLRPLVVKEWDKARSSTLRFVRQSFDAFGRSTYISLPHSSSTTPYGINTQFDGLGRVKNKDNNTTSGSVSYSYISGNRMQINDNRGYVTTTKYLDYGYPSQSMPTAIYSPHSVTTSMSYDIYGNLKSISQGGLTEYRVYDPYFQLCKKVRPDVGNTAYSYNSAGVMVWKASGVSVNNSSTQCDFSVYNSEKQTFSYDALDNIKTISFGDATPTKQFTYDKNSNLTQLSFGGVINNYTYNDRDMPVTERMRVDGIDWTVTHSYNSYGDKHAFKYPGGGSLVFHPNAIGQPRYVGSFANSVTFHPNGLVKSYKHANGCTNTTTLRTSGLPNVQRSRCNSTDALYNQYSYDANNNLTFWDDKQSNSYDLRFTYDQLNRLDNIRTSSNSLIGDMNYDAMGNITKFDSITDTINYAYNSQKRLVSTSGMRNYDFTYDSRGNVTDNGFYRFKYNLANQMTEADGNIYVYDGRGKRVKSVDGTGTNYYMYSLEGKLVHQRINGANRENYYLGSQLVAHQGAGAKAFVHPDLLGTTAAKSNASAAITSRVRYAPFGLAWNHRSGETGKNEIAYTGHKHDSDIGLTYMQARYYDPVIGRFYSNDPVGWIKESPVNSFGRFTYGNNNPYRYTDPDGNFPFDINSEARTGSSIINSNIGAAIDNDDAGMRTTAKVLGDISKQAGKQYAGAAALSAGGAGVQGGRVALGVVVRGMSKALKSLDVADKIDLGAAMLDLTVEVLNALDGNIDVGRNSNGKLDAGRQSGSKSIEQVLDESEQKYKKPELPAKTGKR